MVQQAAVVTRWFAMALLTGATVLYAYQFLMKRELMAWWARFATGAAFVTLTASIGLQSRATGGTELSGHNQLVLLAWALLLVYFVVEHLVKVKVYGTFLVPVSLVLMVVAQFLAGAEPRGLSPAALEQLDDWRIGIHVGLIVFANAGFFIGGAASALYLALDVQLKRHKASALLRRLPSLAQTQTLARRAITLAFPAYTAGILLGTIRAVETDVQGWWADPRVMMSGVVWLVFGLYLLLLYRHEVSGRTASLLAVLGLACVVVLAVLARTLPTGFHVFGL
ncbi:MAG: cytochrome c biogenesis protein CcsA [Coriobacteriia bacterium]|nr:cytochrome c biogenesis protein CcsA [Coriobacteriia bacterium]